MKLALHRSISFWSGLLVMAFIAWAWWDSMYIHSSLNFPHHFFLSAQGGLSVTHNDEVVANQTLGRKPPIIPITEKAWLPSPYGGRSEGKTSVKQEKWKAQHPGVPEWHASRRMQLVYAPPSAWNVFIPHWLILLAVGVIWLGLLVWRARRRREAGVS